MFNGWHYVTEPFIPKELKSRISEIKNSELTPGKENVVWAINQAKKTLRNLNSSQVDDHFPKSFSMMMLIHLIGDIHQPLHAIARIDPKKLTNDAGGNDFIIKYKGTSMPLHAFWDDTLREFPSIKAPLGPKEEKKLSDIVDSLMKEYPVSKFTLKTNSVSAW